MPFHRFLERRRRDRAAASLYLAVVEQARRPDFYARCGVPDTLEGRYDMILLHAWLLLRRLGATPSEQSKALSQAVFDRMFTDMDRNLRELGVSDMRVGKRVGRMAEAFYGRACAYDKALAEGDDALVAALARNLFQSNPVNAAHLAAIIAYIKRQGDHLAAIGEADLQDGVVTFHEFEVMA